MYRSNMQSMVIDMVTEADMVLFNRCTPDMPLSGWKRSIRAVNRMCEIVFEDEKGEELEVEDILPYSLEADTIVLEDEDYGIWYLDIQEHPERYTGKTVIFRAQAMTSMKLPKGTFIPGRNAMTCCAEDIRFFGFLCKYDRSRSLKKGEWVMVAARHQWEESPSIRGRAWSSTPSGWSGPTAGRSPGLFPMTLFPASRRGVGKIFEKPSLLLDTPSFR